MEFSLAQEPKIVVDGTVAANDFKGRSLTGANFYSLMPERCTTDSITG